MTDPNVLQALDEARERLSAANFALDDAHEVLRRGSEPSREPSPVQDEAWNPEPAREKARRRPTVRRKPESDVVADGIALLRQLGYARKVHGGKFGNAGEPDVDACVQGRACKFEAKTGSNKPTAVQVGAMRQWAKAGALVGWFRDNSHILQLLEHLQDPTFVPDLDQPGCSCPLHQAGDQ